MWRLLHCTTLADPCWLTRTGSFFDLPYPNIEKKGAGCVGTNRVNQKKKTSQARVSSSERRFGKREPGRGATHFLLSAGAGGKLKKRGI